MIRYPDNIADFVPGTKPGETGQTTGEREVKFKKDEFDDYTLKHEDPDGDQLRVIIFKGGMLVEVTDYYQLAVELTPKQAHKLAIGILETLEKVK